MPLNLNGSFYPSFTADAQRYSDADRGCVQRTVERLLTVQTSTDRPGMLLGKIQSGKTKTFLAAIALAFDNNFDIAIILTKGTRALAKQTLERVRRDFAQFYEHDRDQIQIFDIMTVPSGLTPYELNQKIIFVAKKQQDNMNRLAALFRETYPQLASKRVLIIDDEADQASIGFRNSRQQGIVVNTTTRQIEELRQLLTASAFLQVTATPYALYLQPENPVINGVEFTSVRPAFTELVPVHANYVGSDCYFDHSLERDTVASFIYQPVTLTELDILHHQDRRRFQIEDCLTSDAIQSLRAAVCNFITGGCIRRLQDQHNGNSPKKFSFLVHTEASRAAHSWQEDIVIELNQKLSEAARNNSDVLRQLLTAAYNNLAASIRVMNHFLPPLEDVVREVFAALDQGCLMIAKVNSERQVEELLDNEGQLRLRTPLNIFIGGQILDRGITVANLIGFFYGRRPQIYQQDTVLQHSRMFGFRPIEDLAVTRFYTDPTIHVAMRRMHESDVALREIFERNPDQAVAFIRRDPQGRIVPCSPNKILISNTTTLRPFKRILPIGFQTDVKTRVAPAVREMDGILDRAANGNLENPFLISMQLGLDLLRKVEPTLLMNSDMGYEFDWDACRAAMEYMSDNQDDDAQRGQIWCLVRRDRNMSRFQPALGAPFFSDAPDTAQREGAVAKRVATNIPMLIMIRQNGLEEEQGWRGTPFYWPVIYAPQNVRVSIFAHETTP